MEAKEIIVNSGSDDIREKRLENRHLTLTDFVASEYRQSMGIDSGKALKIAYGVVSTISSNPYLQKIAKENIGSVVDCVRQAISLDLPVDANQYCWFIPYGNKVTLQIGYKGYIYKIKKIYPNTQFQVNLVYEGDEIKVKTKDNNDYVDHERVNSFSKSNDKIIGVYTIITFDNGKSVVETMDKKEIDLIKSKTKAKDGGVWKEWYGEMAKKAVIKRACKIHFSGEISNLDEFDNKQYDIKTVNKIEEEYEE